MENESVEISEELIRSKHKLEQIRAPRIQGLITRSRVTWHEQGEKCSKYFLGLEKRNAIRKSINSIKIASQVITDKKQILSEFSTHLSEKYRTSNIVEDASCFLENTIDNKLSPEQKTELEKPITLNELTQALQGMKKGRSPGVNGFTASFFRQFWVYIGPFLLRVLNNNIAQGNTCQSFREGIITLIPKPGQAEDCIKGWRPISLLNTDFKIISAAVANRLKSVMDILISPTQSAYIKGRYIGENTRLVYDVIDHLNKEQKTGIILAADFEAAFESIAWNFLKQALVSFNFGPRFRSIIDLLYLNSNNFSRILLEGYLGEKMYLNQGIRQGDPASGYLFNLAVEPLASQLKKSAQCTGIRLETDIEVRLSQYADDLIIFSKADENALRAVVDELRRFSSFSNLKLNLKKTNYLPIGPVSSALRNCASGIQAVDELKILGIKFNETNDLVTETNLKNKIESIQHEIIQWKRRKLTLMGKITVIKSLLLAKMVHIFISLPTPPPAIIKLLEKIIHDFLWNSRSDPVKRSKLVQNTMHDGINITDITSFIKSLKIGWVKRLYTSKQSWAFLVKSNLPAIETFLTYGSKKLKAIVKTQHNSFWKDVFNAWIEFIHLYKPSDECILTSTIWFSNFSKFKTSIIKTWDKNGLRFIGDLINRDTGRFYSHADLRRIYNIPITFLCYESLIRGLPNINFGTNNFKFNRPTLPYQLALINRNINTGRLAYQEFIARLRTKYKNSQEAWVNKWNQNGIETPYIGSMLTICSVTTNTYLQSFHFKIITNVIATNRYLNIIGKSETALCTLCKRSFETVDHLFWTCPKTQAFIGNIKSELYLRFNITLQFEKSNWFLPSLENCTKMEIMLAAIAKLVIYKARLKKHQPNIEYFVNLVRFEVEKESIIARKNDKTVDFNEKWGRLGSHVLQ